MSSVSTAGLPRCFSVTSQIIPSTGIYTRSPSRTRTISTFIAPPTHIRYSSCFHTLRWSSLSIKMRLPLHHSQKTVLTSRNKFRKQSLNPQHLSTTLKRLSRLIFIRAFWKAHDRPTVGEWIFLDPSDFFSKPCSDDKSKLGHITEGSYKVLDLSVHTTVIHRGLLVKRVTVGCITPVPAPLSKTEIHR